jgi:hypothetical protein
MSNKFQVGDGGLKIVKNENIHIFENGSNGIALCTKNIFPVSPVIIRTDDGLRHDKEPP